MAMKEQPISRDGVRELREAIAEACAVLEAISDRATTAAEFAEQCWLGGRDRVPAPAQLDDLMQAFGQLQALVRAGERSATRAQQLAALLEAGG